MKRIEEQIQAARPDRSVLLSASAGSGKTHVLVQRMVHLLAAGVGPDRLAAITFTEKAAAQMKDRLYGALSKAAWDRAGADDILGLGPGDMPYPLTKTPEDIFALLTARPDALQISTVHAFCLKLLRQFPVEAGLPADFSVMDDSEIPIRREQAVDGCIESLRDDGLEGELETLLDAGLSLKAVKALLTLALDRRGQLSRIAADRGGYDKFIGRLDESLGISSKEKAAEEIISGGVLARKAATLSSLLKEYGLGGDGYTDALDLFAGIKGIAGLPGAFGALIRFIYTKEHEFKARTPVSLKSVKDTFKVLDPSIKGKARDEKAEGLKDRHDALFIEFREGLHGLAALYDDAGASRALIAFLKVCRNAEEAYAGLNHRDGLVDYDDLEIHAYRLLTGPDADRVLRRVESKVLHYLVDEFQDTGATQWGILERLNSETFAGQGAEGLMSPTLFAVGDKKQSIYRFRKADYRLMDTLRKKMEERIEPGRLAFPELAENFRSAPEIVRVVNDTFGRLWEGSYRNSRPFRESEGGSVTLRVLPVGDEAGALADEVQASLGLAVWDKGRGVFRPADYGDMAILLRSRSGLMAYEEALRSRGIGYKVTGGVGFFYQPEVQAVMGILGFLEDPADMLSLATALKSPLFRMFDGELEAVYHAKDPLAGLHDANPEAHRLVAAWREKSGVMPLGRLVEEIVRDSAALFSFGLESGPAATLNIEKLIGVARGFDRRGGVGLSEFTEWVKAYRDKAELATADLDLPGFERFVSIMTVHAAKGLEFPVVFLPGAAKKTRGTVDGLLLDETGDGLGIGLKADALLGDNPAYASLKENEGRERIEEAKRLMYVAMTRAKDHLVILAGVREGKDAKEGRKGWNPPSESWLSFLQDARPVSLFSSGPEPGGELPALYRYPAVETPRLEAVTGTPASEGLETHGFMPPGDALSPLPVPPGITFTSPHGLAGSLPAEDDAASPYPAMLRGLLIHSMLESLGRSGRYDVRASAGRTPGFASLDARAGEALMADAERAVSGLLEDAEIKELLSPGDGKYFELPILLKRGGEIISGFADLAIISGGHALVVDYKTGLAGLPRDEIKAAYLPQLDAYREAVTEAFGLESADAYLLLVDRKELVRLD